MGKTVALKQSDRIATRALSNIRGNGFLGLYSHKDTIPKLLILLLKKRKSLTGNINKEE